MRTQTPVIVLNGDQEFIKLLQKTNKITAQDVQDLEAGKKELLTATLYSRKALGATPGGNMDLILKSDPAEVGVTNFENGKIPADINMICSKIQVNYGFSATNVDVTDVDYKNTIYSIGDVTLDAGGSVVAGTGVPTRYIPVKFANAEYRVATSAGGQIMSGLVKDGLINGVDTVGSNDNDDNWIINKQPKFFKAGTDLTIELKFPIRGSALPAGFHYAEAVFQGLYLGTKVNS